jgi:hypothetical protein
MIIAIFLMGNIHVPYGSQTKMKIKFFPDGVPDLSGVV